MNDRNCLHCHGLLTGRANQKFCNSQCRNSYNNSHAIKPNLIRTTNRILRKNYSILMTLFSAGKTTTTWSDLQKRGYQFDYFTFTCITRSCQINYFCYDRGIREQEENKLVLFRYDLTNRRLSPDYQNLVI